MISRFFLVSFVCLFYFSSFSQDRFYRYWIELKDKDTVFSIQRPYEFLSGKSIERRTKYKIAVNESDLPVSKKYIDLLSEKGFKIIRTSKWFNSVTVQSSDKNLIESIRTNPNIKAIKFLGEVKISDVENKPKPVDINKALSVLESKFDNERNKTEDTNYYGKSYDQVNMLNMPALHQMGYMGQGVTIAVIDAGFRNAPKVQVFDYAFENGLVKGTKDFVDGTKDVFDDDDHGIAVWSCMGAYKPKILVGTSPKSGYWLLRSEYSATESPLEESNWLSAAEFADSIGVDIINSSLGYNKYDDKTLSYTYKDLDGKTTIISRAATIAASKGIMVLNSAGNEGDNEWKYLAAPADANDIITVGGVDSKKGYASFSSIGPTSDKRIKPDVAAQGEEVWVVSEHGTVYKGNGTSYACPMMTGVVACLLQANPLRTNAEIIRALQLSSSQYNVPDQFIGYGIPDAVLANKILGGDGDFLLKKDVMLDSRVLNDNKVHICFSLRSAQKIKIVIEDVQKLDSKPVYKENMDCKFTGVKRIALNKLKKLDKGVYAVYLYSKDGVSSTLLIK